MGKHHHSGFNTDLFGHGNKRSRRAKKIPSSSTMTRDEALKINQSLGLLKLPQDSNSFPSLEQHNQDDLNWEDVDDGVGVGIEIRLDSPGDCYARHQKSLRRVEARARIQERWKALEARLTASYLYLQHYTRNWTSQPTFDSYLSDEIQCQCSPENLRKRHVDLIDLLRHTSKHLVTFCECTPDVLRLIHLGYIAGSPQHPCTAFSVRLVRFHHHFWNNTVASTSGFIDALMVFLDEQCASRLKPQPVKKTSTKNINRSLRHPFTQSIDIYRRILLGEQEIYEDGLELTPLDISADRCCRCLGPVEGEVKLSPEEPDFIIAMDGNFQHRHQSHASKDCPQEDQYPSSFIRPSKLEKEVVACQRTDAQAHNIKACIVFHSSPFIFTSCSDSHTAANDVRNSSSWDRCDDTGLFAAACRHDTPLHFINIYQSGEKFRLDYPVAILKQLRELYPDKFIGILYDIGCHLDEHIAKYWGLSDGEGLERLWSFLSALVACLQISTRLHRLLSIHWRTVFYAAKVNEGCGQWLRKRFRNVMKVLREAEATVTSLCAMANPACPGENYSADFFRGQWTVEPEAYSSKQAILLKQKLELGRLLLLKDELDHAWSRPVLTTEQAIARLQTTTELEEKIRKQAAKVGTTDISNLDKEQEAYLKLWYSKHEVGLKFIAICEEKRPLQQSRSDGHRSNLGHKGKTNLMVALRRHTAQLKKLVETYRTLRAEYHAEYPEHRLPEDINYNDLLEIQADHPFWNDSLFTEIEAPWAVDPNTRHGMQQIAYVDRGNEELRRLGWEVRRAMRWATSRHDRIWNRLILLPSEPTPEPNLLTPLLTHPNLTYLPSSARHDAAAVVLKNQFIKITNLQLAWHEGLHEVFTQSQYQVGDEDLKRSWDSQLQHIRALHKAGMSMIPGVLDNMIATAVLDTPIVRAVEEQEVVFIEDDESDLSSLDGDDDDVVSGLVHRLDLVDIQAALDPETMDI
ncbi:uncharacterized protein MELLADRAFT_84832 [Melampsora larici-populina 98AG31]|uniref:CxC1-like cysteine cluster associated with KDZ transposases domain-containing protein n=1 Tax=Melampsora larici-populina (strain 98AG31 / pathotype 3-4-7) TaxID=747676 RepID=F4SCM2_MELLP|nr:uncharacterized protein MELLADRAFT_84832 [Melampsora larici-populina 98AG31]EGF97607.1 hypothetical protein MELLADRAFT_84832 [Melampsora larici-populina 98AG31]